MTTTRVKRLTIGTLDGSFGPDRDKRLVVTFIPGDGLNVPDLLEIKPLRARSGRTERVAVMDIYRYAVKCRANLLVLTKARHKKEQKQLRLARARQARAEQRLIADLDRIKFTPAQATY